MPSPFPGMDPYLEQPRRWPGVHLMLIAIYTELLNKLVRPRYVARAEDRLYMVPDDDPENEFWQVRVPDVKVDVWDPSAARSATSTAVIARPVIIRHTEPIAESRVEIHEVATGDVVTVIEILSPSNKLAGAAGRKSFLEKRDEVTNSPANWVEIDLLRTGTPHHSKVHFPRHQYLVYSSPVELRPKAKAWPIRLQEPLPVVGIPLRDPDPEVPLDLQAALDLAYDRGAYDASADYTKPPVPPLPPALARWSNKLLKQKKLR